MSNFTKVKKQLEKQDFFQDRVSSNNHAIFCHRKVMAFQLTVPLSLKSTGAEKDNLRKAELFNQILDAGFTPAGRSGVNILFVHQDNPKEVISIPSKPKSMGALTGALKVAERINQELTADSKNEKPMSKRERKAMRKQMVNDRMRNG